MTEYNHNCCRNQAKVGHVSLPSVGKLTAPQIEWRSKAVQIDQTLDVVISENKHGLYSSVDSPKTLAVHL